MFLEIDCHQYTLWHMYSYWTCMYSCWTLRYSMGIRSCTKEEVTDCLSLLFDTKCATDLLYHISTLTVREVAPLLFFLLLFC